LIAAGRLTNRMPTTRLEACSWWSRSCIVGVTDRSFR